MGSVLGGFALYLRDGVPRYVHNLYGKDRHTVSGSEPVGAGDHTITFTFTKTEQFQGRGELAVDGRTVGAVDIPHFTPMRFSITGAGLTCGYEVGPAVGDDYEAPFRCNVPLAPVTVDVEGDGHRDPAAEFQAIMAEQ